MLKHKLSSKSSVLTIVLSVLTVSSVWADSVKPLKIFLLGGQSNMVGADKAAKLMPPYNKAFPKVRIWDQKTRRWEPLSPKAEERFGPEVSFGHFIAELLPHEDVRLIKYAAGGTALYNDWDPKTKGRQYLSFMNTTKAALSELDASKMNYEIAGMLWLQGESDAHENKAETYEKNLTEFIAHIRTQFKTPTMPFIIARVRNHYGGKTGQARIVRDAQVKVASADKNIGWFDTDDCSMINAGHYDAAGLIEIGKRFAEEYKKIALMVKKR